MKSVRCVLVTTALLVTLTCGSSAQIQTLIKGYMFGDYFYNFANHNKAQKEQNAFNFRRIYFTFETTLSENISVCYRLEAEHAKMGTSGMNPYVKHAYLRWQNLLPMGEFYLGISATPTWWLSEKIWGYRSLEKTIMDLHKIGSSADMGVGLKGSFYQNKTVNYYFMISNGPGYSKTEDDKFKKIYAHITIIPTSGLSLVAYGDYEAGAGNKNKTTIKGFLGYIHPRFTFGVEGFQRTNTKALSDGSDQRQFGLSIFGSAVLGKKVKLVGRFDRWDPNTDRKHDEENLIIAALDFSVADNVHILPNILVTSYAQERKGTDVIGRITFYYRFDSGSIVVQN